MELQLFEQSWLDVWEGAEPAEPVGAVFTKPEIIELILDLAGYLPSAARLATRRLLEPSCGDGAFVTAAIRRLLASERQHQPRMDWGDATLEEAFTACDVNGAFLQQARQQAIAMLIGEGCPAHRAEALAEKWFVHADFLLTHWTQHFDFVVGNPPYVRIENLPSKVLARYRELYQTSTDRADIYIAFFENGLRLLTPTGRLAYITANRFAKNHYGRALRQLIARDYHVRYYLNLEHTQPFVSEVSAYPCITVLDREQEQPTHAATLTDLHEATLHSLADGAKSTGAASILSRFDDWYGDGRPWIATERASHDQFAALARRYPSLEESAANTIVGIGVATGADQAFVLPARPADIEAACLLPLIMASDIAPSALTWSGHYLANPFGDANNGKLRDLDSFPGLARHFERHRIILSRRHIARKRPAGWYRTIDRINPALTQTPKLLLPDIQRGGVIGYDSGQYYPHHNVYWITSAGWNLRALQALLRSEIVFDQVKAFSVQMRGGSIRYQAQVLRKIRVPLATDLNPDLIARLATLAGTTDLSALNALAREAYR